MKRLIQIICVVITIISFSNCSDNNTAKTVESKNQSLVESAKVSGVPCDLHIGGVHFTKSVNNAASSVVIEESSKVIFTAGEKTDYFSDPDGKLSNTTAPLLLTRIDNSKPFTFSAKVTPGFTDDVYNAGVLYIYINDLFFQKHCFEQDERGKHRIVTVRTIGTSDDNNHDIIEQPYAYMKISSDTRTVASYYSLDNKNWQMVRLYENNYPNEIWVGISCQCPMGKGTQSIFEELNLELKSVSDFRLGI